MADKRTVLGSILVVLAAMGFGSMPIFAMYAYKGGITVPALLFIRFSIAAVVLFAFVFIKYGRPKITWKDCFSLFILGSIFYTMQSSFYLLSIKYIPASLAALILYVFPLIVAGMSAVFFKEKITVKVMAAMLLSFAGLVLILGTSYGHIDFRGAAFALGAAVVYSSYIVLGNKVVKDLPAPVMSAFITLFTAIGVFVYGTVAGQMNFNFASSVWVPAIGLAFCATVFAMLAFFKGLDIAGPTKSSVLSMAEPLFTIVMSAFLLGESLTIMQIIGGIAVLVGAVLAVVAHSGNDAIGEEYM